MVLWYCVFDGVGVYMCVVVCFSMYARSCGVCKWCVGLVCPCMHIIEVSDGSTYW